MKDPNFELTIWIGKVCRFRNSDRRHVGKQKPGAYMLNSHITYEIKGGKKAWR